VTEDDDGEAGGSDFSTRDTSVEPKTQIAYSSAPSGGKTSRPSVATPYPPTVSLDRPTSSDVAFPQHADGWVGGEDEHRAKAVVSPLSDSAPPLPQQSEAGPSVLEEEWEIRKTVGKRWAERATSTDLHAILGNVSYERTEPDIGSKKTTIRASIPLHVSHTIGTLRVTLSNRVKARRICPHRTLARLDTRR
jgi:hypothetical protein